ncbi:hypothetical protein ACTFIU_003615 [Dictyostelium citrinum]
MLYLEEINKIIIDNLKIDIPNNNDDKLFLELLHKEGVEKGLWNQNDKKGISTCVNLGIGSKYMHPNESLETKLFISKMHIWFLTFDNLIDYNSFDDESTEKLYKRTFNLIMDNKLPNNFSNIEEYYFFIFNEYRKKIGDDKELLNRFLYKISEYMQSLKPFNILSKMDSSIPIEIIRYIRNNNFGTTIFLPIIEIIHQDKKISSLIWWDQKLLKLLEISSYILGLINDLVSYEREIKGNNVSLNIFYIYQKKLNLSIKDSFEKIKNELLNSINEIKVLETELIEKYPKEINLGFYLNYLHQLIWGELQRSLNCNYYSSKDSIFFELKSHD